MPGCSALPGSLWSSPHTSSTSPLASCTSNKIPTGLVQAPPWFQARIGRSGEGDADGTIEKTTEDIARLIGSKRSHMRSRGSFIVFTDRILHVQPLALPGDKATAG
ncbi:hypothetical protein MIC448_1610005 [Microbacterium sp. C448]|nr:hypothetical protein MIC448_1610005 [Microbacterium sp. C448]